MNCVLSSRFKITSVEDKNTEIMLNDNPISEDLYQQTFEMLIMTYLQKNGIDELGNKSAKPNFLKEDTDNKLKQWLELLGFNENIEEVIMKEWKAVKSENKDLRTDDFTKFFVNTFHNNKVEEFAPDFIRERNQRLFQAYQWIIVTIEKIQGFLEDERMRTRIESDLINHPLFQSTIHQCTTPFCIVSLGCDPMGRYSIVYSVDYRFQEMISQYFASILIRRIYDYTNGDMADFVRIGSLCQDCLATFQEINKESKSVDYHKIIIKEKNIM
jgi:hypothetical protein